MNTFEIVRGVDGDCLVLDGTRICGPKPWGGGRIIKTFRTDGIYEVIDKVEYRKLVDENAKLRELVRELWTYAEQELVCDWTCPYGAVCDWRDCVFTRRMRELGVEVDA